jgi:hypothetical protein
VAISGGTTSVLVGSALVVGSERLGGRRVRQRLGKARCSKIHDRGIAVRSTHNFLRFELQFPLEKLLRKSPRVGEVPVILCYGGASLDGTVESKTPDPCPPRLTLEQGLAT